MTPMQERTDRSQGPATRRAVIGGMAASSLSMHLRDPAFAAEPTERSLGEIAADRGLLFGASFATHELDKPTARAYAEMYTADARIITSELEFKLSVLSAKPGSPDFAAADRLMHFAEKYGLRVRGHTLIWNDDLPDWIKTASNGAVARFLDEHIVAVMTRYKGRVRSWDVVNEPIAPWESSQDKLRSGPFLRALGGSYIARSFQVARAVDPSARLVLNEQSTDRWDDYGTSFRQNFANLVDRLLDAGTPIDAIGLQCHLMPSKPFDHDGYARYIERFTRAGLEVHITELDVDDGGFPDAIAERDRAVGDHYRSFLSTILANTGITELIAWQLGDRHSGAYYQALERAGGTSGRMPRPLLYDTAYQRKPAWHAVSDALTTMPPRETKRSR